MFERTIKVTMNNFFDNCLVFGSDPGPESSAIVCIRVCGGHPKLVSAAYSSNESLRHANSIMNPCGSGEPCYLAYEKCGTQFGRCVGESVFETAAMGGEIRRAFRPVVAATYAFKSSEWRYLLCGQGNAKTPMVYAEICALFEPTGGGSNPYKGTKDKPGPLWALHEAGKGGNVEHLKDALGCALALTRCEFRTGAGPEKYQRRW